MAKKGKTSSREVAKSRETRRAMWERSKVARLRRRQEREARMQLERTKGRVVEVEDEDDNEEVS